MPPVVLPSVEAEPSGELDERGLSIDEKYDDVHDSFAGELEEATGSQERSSPMTGSVLNEVFLNSSEKCESALTSPVQPLRIRVGDSEEGEESSDEARDDPPKGEDATGVVPRCEVPSGDVTGVKFA